MMTRISKNNKTIRYVENPKDVMKNLPDGAPDRVSIKGTTRYLLYGDDDFKVEVVDKEKGIYEGNICPICEAGEMVDYGGCMTCNNCGSQLKCGL